MANRKKRNKARSQESNISTHPKDDILEHRSVPGNAEKQLSILKHSREEYYSGPLPLPEHIAQYEAILSGAADRIFAMAERTQSHRIEMDKGQLEFANKKESNENKYAKRGQLFSFLLLVSLVPGACFCAYLKYPWVATAFVAPPFILAMAKVSSFLIERGRNKTDEVSKDDKSALAKS